MGEWLIATWSPRLVLLSHEQGFEVDVPELKKMTENLPESQVDGFLLRQASPRIFSPGVGRLNKWISYVPRIDKLHFVEIVGSFEAYLGRRSAKSRYNIKRAVQRIRLGGDEPILEVLTDPKDMARFQSAACLISRETYQGKLLDAGFPGSSGYLDSMVSLAKKGCVRAYLLKELGEPIAFAWCTSQGRQLTYQIIGYLPDRSAVSPGTVLLTLILEDVFLCGQYDRFDFGVGDAPYKASFATNTIEFADVYLFRSTWLRLLLVWLHWQTDRLSSGAGELLDRWGIKRRIKMLMRRMRGAGSA